MLIKLIFLSLLVIIGSIILFTANDDKNNFQTLLENSGPYIGVSYPNESGLDGSGIIIGVIDTGIDYTHPDLFGFGQTGKVIQGTSFINEDEGTIDSQGHGTQVAGIIAADGQLTGIAPKLRRRHARRCPDADRHGEQLLRAADRTRPGSECIASP